MNFYSFFLLIIIIVVLIHTFRGKMIPVNFRYPNETFCSKELEPKDNIYDFEEKNNQYRLVPKSDFRNKFKFNFKIPDLKFDGIYSRIKENGKCKWSLCDENIPDFFGTNKLSPIPEKSLFGKIIIEPPECAGFENGYSPLTYYIPNNDCSE